VPTYSLPELAKLADVTPRTIRYYVAQGLLPAPELQGPNTRYTEEHLARLLAIKRLQTAHLPLAEIRQQLRKVPDEQLATLAAFGGLTPSAGSAVDYIRDVLRGPAHISPPPAPVMPAPPTTEPPPEPPQARSQWERISLDPDIELHVRRPLTRQNNKRVERLIAIAHELFEED
jgi:DNA-binding transcriptional MerR regulator